MTETATRLAAALAGRYRIDRELGAGGMATVWLAQDLKHDRKVAIKVLHPHLAALVGAERFLKEIKTTANLQHPHILALHDSGEADGLLFYVMPFVEGESLRDRLTRDKQLPIADAVRLTGEVAGALDYAHRQGVVHRDIKPENILLHDGHAVVADFGIALAPATGDTRLTETGLSIGTPSYMSPEQALGERQLDARSDIYAVGAVLYEMLTGTPPFTGPSAQAIVAKVLTEKPVPPSRKRDDVPAPVDAAVLTALQKEPADRFPTAAAFQAALASNVTGGKIRRRGLGLPAMVAIGLTAVLILVALVLRPWQARPRIGPRHLPDTAAVRLVVFAGAAAEHRDPQHCDQAIELYSQATDKDSLYAKAWGGLAEAYALCALFGSGDPAVRFTAAKAAAGNALQLDSTRSDAYTARGMFHLFHEQKWSDAQRDFTQAIALDTSRFEPWLFRTWYYFAVNELDSAVRAVARAKEIAPLEAIGGVRLATALRYKGDLNGAERELRDVLTRDPTNPIALLEQFELDAASKNCVATKKNLAFAEHSPGQYNKALAAYSQAWCSDRPRAQHFADSLSALAAAGTYVDLFALAMVYAGLRDSAKMFESLDQAITKHNWALFYLGHHFAFQPYRDTPEFRRLMARANVK